MFYHRIEDGFVASMKTENQIGQILVHVILLPRHDGIFFLSVFGQDTCTTECIKSLLRSTFRCDFCLLFQFL